MLGSVSTTLVHMAFVPTEDMLHGSPLDGWTGRFFHSKHMTFARWTIADDASDLHEHQHEQEEVWNVVRGSVVLILDGVEGRVDAGAAAVIPSNTPHAVRVVAEAEVVVTDYPLRLQLPGVSPSS
jgi:mannose-6-phosphate isomerase-like protein (cupin superfamily)